MVNRLSSRFLKKATQQPIRTKIIRTHVRLNVIETITPKTSNKEPQQNYRLGTVNQRTNGPVNAHLISWLCKAQNIQNLEYNGKEMTLTFNTHIPS